MFDEGKIVIIGASNVGTAVLNKVVDFGLASEVVLIDINKDKCLGESLDTSHATACITSHNIYIHEGDYEDCKDASMIIITAGPSIKPGETPDRLILTKTNCKIMDSIMSQVVRYTKDAIILVVTNPLDVATYYVSTHFDYPREKIIGTGTLLETFRLRRILADYYYLDPKLVHGYVLGEHGNSGFVAWSSVDIASLGLENMDDFLGRDYKLNKGMIEQKIMKVVYDVINLKGCTNTGIAMVVSRFIKAIKYNEYTILPLSSVLTGEYGIHDVALSLPCMLNDSGIVKKFTPKLTDQEIYKMISSAKSVKAAMEVIEKKVNAVA